jgi:hypothetical protein
MPIRHEDDYRRKHIASWDAWIEDAILESQERGEFDNLPDAGKPIRLEDTPYAPDMASALRTLKNAGYEPTWMELDRQITRGRDEMAAFLSRSKAYLDAERARILQREAPDPTPAVGARWRRWLHILRHGTRVDESPVRTLSLADLVLIRARMREQYLERAAAVDKLVVGFHAVLPRNLWHLERLRVPPDRAAKAFDESIPAIS